MKHHVNGLKDEEGPAGNYRLRRKSTTDPPTPNGPPPPKMMKTKAVKRKRQSDVETATEQTEGGVKLLHNNNVKLPVTLEITPVPGSTKSSTSSTSSSSSTS